MSALALEDLRERVRKLPGMDAVLPALEGLPPTFLVGGAVRDLLRGAAPKDLDFMVEGDARPVAGAVAERLGRAALQHDRFGTATVSAQPLELNFASARRETYPAPGALPEVEPATLAQDLVRRDFTVNAMALGLTGEKLGHLYDPLGGVADLERGVVRVLHERSFLDDPTRLLRALRYEVRLDFAMDTDSELLAVAAVEAGALGTVSGARVRDELLDLLAEADSAMGVERMSALGVDRALHPALVADPELVASAALGAVTIGADPVLAALAALCSAAPAEVDLWLDDLNLGAARRDATSRAARVGPRLAHELRARAHKPSELHDLLAGEPLEALALALAMRAPSDPVLSWVGGLAGVALEISGADLLRAGVAEGPALGRALEETLRRKLDGEVAGREQELSLALSLAREADG